MSPEALRHLAKSDPVLGRVIRRIGPCTLAPRMQRSPFESLVRAVAHQQLHGVAAERILGRFIALFPRRRFPSAADLAHVSDADLRAVGFSGAKSAALRDIAEKTLARVVPTPRKIRDLPDDEIIERLTTIRGVGRWTVEMLLIFQLGRPDVLPVDDFGVRNGFRIAYELPEMPKPKELVAHGERWAPYRTTAAWYLWRAADEPLKTPKVRATKIPSAI
jgi:DNA-3-methyladenine glycosylase II